MEGSPFLLGGFFLLGDIPIFQGHKQTKTGAAIIRLRPFFSLVFKASYRYLTLVTRKGSLGTWPFAICALFRCA